MGSRRSSCATCGNRSCAHGRDRLRAIALRVISTRVFTRAPFKTRFSGRQVRCKMLRQLVDRLVDASGRRPIAVMVTALTLLLGTWAYASRIEVRSDLLELLPRDSPSF